MAITTYAVYDEGFTWSLAILAVVLILFRSLEQSSYAYFRGRGHVEYEALHLTLSRLLVRVSHSYSTIEPVKLSSHVEESLVKLGVYS